MKEEIVMKALDSDEWACEQKLSETKHQYWVDLYKHLEEELKSLLKDPSTLIPVVRLAHRIKKAQSAVKRTNPTCRPKTSAEKS